MSSPPPWPHFARALDAIAAATNPSELADATRPLMTTLGAQLLVLVSRSHEPGASGDSSRGDVLPPGFLSAQGAIGWTSPLLDAAQSRRAAFRLGGLAEGGPAFRALFARFDLHDGLCVPRIGRDGGRELALLAGPALALHDTAAAAAARIVVESFADRVLALAAERRRRERRSLTARQQDCLRAAMQGLNSIQIAYQLQLAPRTVDAYIAAAARRLGAPNRVAAVGAALQLGLLP